MLVCISVPLLTDQGSYAQRCVASCFTDGTRPVNLAYYLTSPFSVSGVQLTCNMTVVDSPIPWLPFVDELVLFNDFGLTDEMRADLEVADRLNKWLRFRRIKA